ncbi:MAG: HNH endonuclease domain-containing protein [Bacteroidales bacterium]
MEKILGIDLGTNSIGLTLRENDAFSWYGVYTFKKGVGEGKSGEFSFAAERTKHRASRRLYNARRYRKWETLKALIENGYCPLDIDDLNNWKHYKKGIGRVFPLNDEAFQQWIKLDFNGDGKPDFSSPYQLRWLLITEKLDLSIPENRFKIGRALYHIAQRRGFKSSRKNGDKEKSSVYNGGSDSTAIPVNKYKELLKDKGGLGAAFAYLEDDGIRVRNRYTLRSDYRDEVKKILEFQEVQGEAFNDKLLLETKNGSIFYQRPLRSQKGLVGKCTLEPSKLRCPVSHPKFEEYRAWSFINNIKYRTDKEARFEPIPLELKEKLYHDKFFFKSKREFDFSEIRKFIKLNGGSDWELNYSQKMDKVSVSSCFVSARLKSVFCDDWQNFEKKIKRTNKKGEDVIKNYTIDDIWHILFSFEDEEYFVEFLIKVLELEEGQVKELENLFDRLPVGYANLSLKAINNILPFLREGLIYAEAVILAKIPEIIGKEFFEADKDFIINAIKDKIAENRHQKKIIAITNNLIFKYYASDYQNRFGWKDTSYKLDDADSKDIKYAAIEHFGDKTWDKFDDEYRQQILSEVSVKYQEFFASSKREHIKAPHLVNQIKDFLEANFDTPENLTKKIYHPSQIDIYPKKEGQQFLMSPKTAAFKNPMAYKTLYRLRDVINYLIEIGKIDQETRIVVEIARELNDRNKRWAIEKYQNEREVENREFGAAISELLKNPEFIGEADSESKDDIDKIRLLIEQTDEKQSDEVFELRKIMLDPYKKLKEKNEAQKSLIKKYRLWLEQGMRCMYTGNIIKLTDLFNTNEVDFEHTIPRSKSFDNSLANLTVCYADYNRNIKKNKMPTELPNFKADSNGYSAIKPRLEAWEKKVEHLFNQIDVWKTKSKNAKDKAEKDNAIRTKHLWQMEYDYWRNKLDRFNRTEVPKGFVNSQLVDTQIITKYAYHYLKTVFGKVDVIKGSNTAKFRKIYNIQPKIEFKDRSKHYHHAIDAAVLTLIPSSRKREEILKKAYEFEEENRNKQYHEKPFSDFKYSMIEEIHRNILINNIADWDQTLTPGKKIVRKRGRVVWLRDRNGKLLLDENGNKIPKIAQGDSIRGELHQQTYYGKIKMAAKDENGSLQRNEEGNIIYNQVDGKDEMWMVLRKPIENVNFKSDIIVDEHLAEHLKRQLFEDKVQQNKLKDFNGKTIRHLRCRVKSGRGFMNADNVTKVKEQVYTSSKVYKNYIWADSGENFMFGLYENDKGKEIISINKFEAARYIESIGIPEDKKDLFRQKEPVFIKNKEAILLHIFELGQKVIFYNTIDELKDIEFDKQEISKRLYFIKRLHQASVGNMLFQHHLEARNDEELIKAFPKEIFKSAGKDGFSKYQNDFIAPRILFKPTKPNFIIEGKDFEMKMDGSIEFKF